MVEYKLRNDISSDKLFLINNSDIEGRIDAYYYKQEFINLIEQINNSKFNIVRLKDIAIAVTNGYDFRDYKECGTPYIKVANVKKGAFDLSSIQYIDFDSTSISKNIQLKKGNLLLTRKGTFGNALSIDKDYDYVISSEVFYITLKQEVISSKYLEIFFNSLSGQKLFDRIKIGAIMGSLSQDAIRAVKLPLPPLTFQNEIVDIYNRGYNQKQKKEAEAQALLDSIDGYLLGELGITLPVQDNSLEKRIFRVGYSNVQYRHDPFYYKNLKNIMQSSLYDEVRLHSIANIMKGQSITKLNIEEGNYPVIAGGQSSPYSHNVYNHRGNVITVSASGAYSGYVWYHNSPIFASDCSVVRSKDESSFQTLFLYEIMKFKQSEIYRLQQGAGQPHVYPSDLAKINIPLLPFENQTKIIIHIQDIRNKAKQLQAEAQAILENAKQEVEKMILG